MNRNRFFAILEAFGAEPRRWPTAERAEALVFAGADAEAGAALRRAEELDGLLDESRPLAPSPALRRRIVEAAPQPRVRRSALRWFAPGAGLAAAGVAGLVFGVSLLAPPEAAPDALLADLDTYEVLGGFEPAEGQL
jgi:hypothetical protein